MTPSAKRPATAMPTMRKTNPRGVIGLLSRRFVGVRAGTAASVGATGRCRDCFFGSCDFPVGAEGVHSANSASGSATGTSTEASGVAVGSVFEVCGGSVGNGNLAGNGGFGGSRKRDSG